MKGNSEIVEALNETLTAELTAINQYFIHYRMRTNWGFERIGKKSFEESIGEMKHAGYARPWKLMVTPTSSMMAMFIASPQDVPGTWPCPWMKDFR